VNHAGSRSAFCHHEFDIETKDTFPLAPLGKRGKGRSAELRLFCVTPRLLAGASSRTILRMSSDHLSSFCVTNVCMFTMLRAAEFERHKLCATPLAVPPLPSERAVILPVRSYASPPPRLLRKLEARR
jgi:hypothetical protein